MDEKFAQFAIAHILYRQQFARVQKLSSTVDAIAVDPICKDLSWNWKMLLNDRMLEEKRQLDSLSNAMNGYRERLIAYCERNRNIDQTLINRTICGLRVTVTGLGLTPAVVVSGYLCKLV